MLNQFYRDPLTRCDESFRHTGSGKRTMGWLTVEVQFHKTPRFNQLVQIDAGSQTHCFEHEDEVVGDNVAAGARRKRTAAESAER